MKAKQYSFLEPGEIVQWEGPVTASMVFAYSPLALIGALLTYIIIVGFRQDPQEATHNPVFWMMSGMTLIALLSPLQAWYNAGHTIYLLTNRRAIVVEPFQFGRVESFRPSEWKLEIRRASDGSGSINFARFGMGGRLGFRHLADLSVVEPLVHALAAAETK